MPASPCELNEAIADTQFLTRADKPFDSSTGNGNMSVSPAPFYISDVVCISSANEMSRVRGSCDVHKVAD